MAASRPRVGYPVAAIVKELGRLAGEEAAHFIHLGATTQDILDTAMVLQLREVFPILRRDLVAHARGLAARAVRYGDTPMAGGPPSQLAVPITIGAKSPVWPSRQIT